MKKLSTGDDSTLGVYRAMCIAVFGEESACTKFIEKKIAESENGADEEVIADESQMMYVFAQLLKSDQQAAGLYSMVHGENKYATMLMSMIDVPKSFVARYRDAYTKDGKVIVYTRNGGLNRDSEKIKDFLEEITHHNLYVEDYDDKDDNTYAYIVFNIPDEFKQAALEIEGLQGEVLTVGEKFRRHTQAWK